MGTSLLRRSQVTTGCCTEYAYIYMTLLLLHRVPLQCLDEDNSVTVIRLLPGFAGSDAFVGHLLIFCDFCCTVCFERGRVVEVIVLPLGTSDGIVVGYTNPKELSAMRKTFKVLIKSV